MTESLEQVTKKDLHDWLVNEGFAGLHESMGARLAERLSECWVIYYVPHCGCDIHGDSEGCDIRCQDDGHCNCKFEVRKIRPEPQPELPKSMLLTTWPDDCPQCGAAWRYKSRTMGKALSQPHNGICTEGHVWYEGVGLQRDR